MLQKFLNFLRSMASEKHTARRLATSFSQANTSYHQGEHLQAIAICRQILERQPRHFQSLGLLVKIAVKRELLGEAITWSGKIIDLKPSDADAFYNRGNMLKDLNNLEAALSDYDVAIGLNPLFVKALCNRGVVMQRLGLLEQARDSYERTITLQPNDALAHYNLAGLLRQLELPQEALASYARAISSKPDYLEALCNRGVLLASLKQWDGAMACYDRAIEVNPSFFLTHYYRGALLHERRRWDAALASFNMALDINPGHPESYCHRGILFTALMRWDDAIADLGRAVSLRPELAEAHFGLGNLYAQFRKNEDAIRHFERSIALRPDYLDAIHNRGNSYLNSKQFEAAIASYDQVCAIDPGYRFLLGTRLHAKMNVCDWSNLSAEIERLKTGLIRREAVSPPFPVLTLIDSESLQLSAARLWVGEKFPEDMSLPAISTRSKGGKVRIGYFSADFYDHPVAILTAQLFEIHDRSRFDIVAFSLGPSVRDGMRERLERSFDSFIDVSGKSDQQIALLARSLNIDIAIDLMGFTANNRTGVFACRAAPIQINYLGYPGTMGAEYFDYLVGDQTVIPLPFSLNYSEKIIYLPNSYLPYDSTRKISDVVHSRHDLGLPPSGFVFCCFNNNYKIEPSLFGRWMRILVKCKNSVLWLAQNNVSAAKNLRREAAQHGVDESRLIFAERVPSAAEHLSRQRAADLFLDTLPYNAHATAIDAIWAGLPVLTCIGDSFAGRVAASLLRAIDLPELIVRTMDEYEELAVQLASDRARFAAIRNKMATNRLVEPLFDTFAFARHLEAGYMRVYERYHAGFAPDHIYIDGTVSENLA